VKVLSGMKHSTKQPGCIDGGQFAFIRALTAHTIHEMEVEAPLAEGSPSKEFKRALHPLLSHVFGKISTAVGYAQGTQAKACGGDTRYPPIIHTICPDAVQHKAGNWMGLFIEVQTRPLLDLLEECLPVCSERSRTTECSSGQCSQASASDELAAANTARDFSSPRPHIYILR
jgi:hypothetical protein